MANNHSRGVTLLDTIVGTALMLVVFLSIAATFRLAVDVVSTNKARAGAIALADERMEYLRSIAYDALGTVGGVPSGTLAQSESLTLNGIPYTRRTVIRYGDDPKDGVGAADTDGNVSDYKAVKVDVSWATRSGTRDIALVSRVDPPNGVERACTPPCGTLSIAVVNESSTPLSGVTVHIVNSNVSPAVDVSTFTDMSGLATLIGAPAGAGYSVTVSETGYSTAQTYAVTAENTNPNPGNLTVSNGQTTTGTFAIDVLGEKIVKTWTQVLPGTWSDTFDGTGRIATSTGITVGGGVATLSTPGTAGEVQSTAIGPSYLAQWKDANWSDSQPASTSIRYYVYDGAGANLIPDSQLPGNSTGFTSGPIDLTGISTSTYSTLRLDAVLSASSTSPALSAWQIDFTAGPTPLANLSFTLQGAKTIGSGPNGSVYKYLQDFSSGASASIAIPNLEWDSYTISEQGTSTGYDIASSCAPQAESLSPGQILTTNLYFAPHTSNSLLVEVRSAATGALVPNAAVRLFATGYDTTIVSDGCGQAFFPGLASGSTYSVSVSATGYTTYTSSSVSASGATKLVVTLN